MYAKLCKVINDNLKHYESSKENKKNLFNILLLAKCKEEFENRRKAFEIFENQNEPLSVDDEEQRTIAKQKMLGNIRFICELGKQQLLPEPILHECIKQLLFKKKNQSFMDKVQDLECLCEIMKNIGYLLEANEEARGFLDQYFNRMEIYSKNHELNSRIRFMLLDVIDLRKNHWVPRQKESLPSTISDPRSDSKEDVLYSQYNFPYIRPNVNMKSPRYDDVFSQINLGPYYLGTGPGAINDINQLPNMNNQRRSNYPNNFQKNSLFSGSNYMNMNSNQPQAKRDVNFKQNYQQQNQPSGNMSTNGLNQLNVNRELQNLPPRFQKQINKQANNLPFQPFVKNDNENRINNPSYKMNEDNNLKQGQIFQMQNNYNKYPNPNRPNMNGKDGSNFINEMSHLKIEDNLPIAASNSDSNKVNVIVKVEKLLAEYFKNENIEEFIDNWKLIDINFDDTLLLIIRISIGNSEKERELANKLICKIKKDSIVSETTFLSSLKNLFCKISELEVETPRAKSFVAAFVANSIIEEVLTLKEIGDLLDGGQFYPLFPLLLQHLHKAKGQAWLFDSFTESKINLINMLPENDRNKERMADILEDRNLTFLYPMLRIESDITRQITSSECTPTSLYRWLKDNVNPTLQNSAEFISVVFTTLLKHIVSKHNNAESHNLFTNVHFTNQENELGKFQQVLQVFLNGKPNLQLVVLYSLQTYCSDNNFPKGLIEKWFNMLYEFEIVEEDVFFKWKEDINDEYPGKGNALFQVNKWLTWLEEAEEDEEE